MTSLPETDFVCSDFSEIDWSLLLEDFGNDSLVEAWSLLPKDLSDESGSVPIDLSDRLVIVESLVKRCERHRSLVPLTPDFLASIDIENHATKPDKKAFELLMDFKQYCPSHLEYCGQAIRDDLQRTDATVRDLLSRPTGAMQVVNETLPEAIAFLLFMRDVRRQRVSKTTFLLVASCLEGRGLLCCHAGVNPTGRYLCYRRVHQAIVGERRY